MEEATMSDVEYFEVPFDVYRDLINSSDKEINLEIKEMKANKTTNKIGVSKSLINKIINEYNYYLLLFETDVNIDVLSSFFELPVIFIKLILREKGILKGKVS